MFHPRGPLLVAAVAAFLVAQVHAQDAGSPPPASPENVEALIKRLQEKVDRLSKATSERDEALKYLEEQVEAATGQLGASERTTDTLRSKTEALSTTLETLAKDREILAQQLEQLEDDRSRRIRELEERLAALEATLAQERQERETLATALRTAEHDLGASRERAAALEATVGERDQQLAELQAHVAEFNELLASEREQGRSLEESLQVARAELTASHQQVAELQAAVAQRDRQVNDREARLAETEKALGASRQEVAQLTRLLKSTTEQLHRVAAALDASEAQVKSQEATIGELAQRLNAALLSRVEELAQYRSEFFGRLRNILGDRPDIRIVGDRFVFQSELLFASGSAQLGREGEAKLRELATSLKEVAARIPEDLDWVLRVDGHTDRVPVNPDGSFRSNWELSTARAISVVEFLIGEGIPPERLVAAGFGEYQPLDPRDDEIGYRRNRRIEFKLTER